MLRWLWRLPWWSVRRRVAELERRVAALETGLAARTTHPPPSAANG